MQGQSIKRKVSKGQIQGNLGRETMSAGISGREDVPYYFRDNATDLFSEVATKLRQAKPARSAFITHPVGRSVGRSLGLLWPRYQQYNPCAAYIVTPRSIGLPDRQFWPEQIQNNLARRR